MFTAAAANAEDETAPIAGGSFILTGRVDTWPDYSLAAQEAYEAGAAYVDKRLTVRHGGRNSTHQGVDPSIMLWPRPASPEVRIQ
ncbi:MAG: hypothetical protein ACOCWR_01915 [Oceanidesulfovibrio sp.]